MIEQTDLEPNLEKSFGRVENWTRNINLQTDL